MQNVAIAVGTAAVAGGFLAATGVLQQRAASARPSRESLSFRLLVSLAHDRLWLLGLLTGVISYAFQALALAFGPLALVQPVFLSELLFAIPVSLRLRQARMGPREWTGVLSVIVGLATAIVAADPKGGDPLASLPRWLAATAIVAVIAGLAVLAGKRTALASRASLYALGGATVLALQSGFLNATVKLMEEGPVQLFTAWQPYSLIPATAFGVLLVESAYQAGPLAASMPVIDAAEPAVAIAIGLALFGERVETAPLRLAGTAFGLALLLAGILLLDTSALVRRLEERAETSRKGGTAADP